MTSAAHGPASQLRALPGRQPDPAGSTLLLALLRARYVVLIGLGLIMLAGSARRSTADTDWLFFVWGSDLLFGEHYTFRRPSGSIEAADPGGFHLYANYPMLQIGPPAFALAKVLQVGPGEGVLAAAVVVQALAVVSIACLDRAFARDGWLHQVHVLVGGALAMIAWGWLAHFRHLDDALALTFLSGAVLALCRKRPALAGALIGLAAASKPWALVALPLVLVAARARGKVVAAATAVAALLLCWGPFVAADVRTLSAGSVGLFLSPDSTLAAVGIASIDDPGALRLIQLAVGLALCGAAMALGAWQVGLVAAFSARLLLDPAAYGYYGASVVLAALVADLGRQARVPTFTCVAGLGLLGSELTTGPFTGWSRGATFILILLLAVASAVRTARDGDRRTQPLSATAPSALPARPTPDPPGADRRRERRSAVR